MPPSSLRRWAILPALRQTKGREIVILSEWYLLDWRHKRWLYQSKNS